MRTNLIHAAAAVAVLFTPLATTAAEEKLTAAEAKEIAKEAFFWGMHPVSIYHLRYKQSWGRLEDLEPIDRVMPETLALRL